MATVDTTYFDDAFMALSTNVQSPQDLVLVDTEWFDISCTSLDFQPGLTISPTITDTSSLRSPDSSSYPFQALETLRGESTGSQQGTEKNCVALTAKHRLRSGVVEAAPEKKGSSAQKRKSTRKTSDIESSSNRDRVRARNRVAASKFRVRQKSLTNTLKEETLGLESLYHELYTEQSQLKYEVYRLKVLLMSHADCHDDNIDLWMKGEVHNFIEKGIQEQMNGS